jgi:hypothetical protein
VLSDAKSPEFARAYFSHNSLDRIRNSHLRASSILIHGVSTFVICVGMLYKTLVQLTLSLLAARYMLVCDDMISFENAPSVLIASCLTSGSK